MLGKENIEKQVEMDYRTDVEVSLTESAIGATVDYEDRSSIEEFQRRQSYRSQGSSIRSSSTSRNDVWYSASTDAESMVKTANCINPASDKVMKKAAFFVKTFVKKVEEKLSEYHKRAKPDSKTRKAGTIVNRFASIVSDLIPPSPLRLGLCKINEGIGFFSAKEHRREAKKVSAVVTPFKSEMRKILVKDGLEIFQNFEEQMTRVVDISWERGIEKLAIDAASRVINYILINKEKFPAPHITKGVVLGKSKRKHQFTTHSGHRVRNKQSGEILITSQLYENVGIKKIEGGTTKYYQLKEYDDAEKYGYRLPFAWELEKWEDIEQKYVLSKVPEEKYVYILDEEKKKKLAGDIFKEINGKDPVEKKDIEKLHEKLDKLQLCKEKDKNARPFSFDFGHLPEFFIERRAALEELTRKLHSRDQEVKMSRMVLINGAYGTGKSELARSYGYNKGSNSNIGRNVVWINAKTCYTLLNSFRNLAKELKISTGNDNDIDHNIIPDGEIESIVKDVYEKFQDVESLFIFSNASEYKDIEKFLPPHFSDLFFGREKPYVLITSCNKNWEERIERIELDKGFSLGEAITLIEQSLEIKDSSYDDDLVKLAKALKHLPLALKQSIAYIKQQEKINISEYLERYNEAMQEAKPDLLVILGISPELFTSLKVNFDKIKGEENIGQQSYDILACMAYFSSDKINIEEIFLQKKSEKDKQRVLDTFSLLNKLAMIELEESIAKIHMGIQKIIRVEKEQEGTEEETLRRIMTSFCLTSTDHITSVWSHISKYERLVNEFIDSIYDGDATILHLLAKDGNEEVIRLILEKIDPNKLSKVINAVDEENFTSLNYAAMYGHLEIVKYFIEKGSNLYDENDELSPLHWAAICGQLEIIKYFIDNRYWELDKLGEEDNAPLYYAVKHGHLEIIKYLVEKGGSMDLRDDDGMSPVHYAIVNGHLDIAEYLLNQGANMNTKDNYNNTPLDYAVIIGNLDIAEYLLKLGAKMSQKSKDFLYHYATVNNCSDIINYLEAPSIPKKRKLENVSATSEENVSNIQLLQIENLSDRMQDGICIEREINSWLKNINLQPLVNNSINNGM